MQKIIAHAASVALLVTVASACRGQDKPEQELNPAPTSPRPDVLRDVPILAASRQIDTTGASDAERSTWTVAMPFDSVTGYYRRILPPLGWSVMSDQGDTALVDLYLRKERYALWVHVERKPLFTLYTLITSMADSLPRATTAVPGTPHR